MRFRFALSVLTLVGGLWVLQSSCVPPKPQSTPRRIASIDSGDTLFASPSFAAYLGTLSFVSDSEAGDRQALLVGHYPDAAHYGPLANIAPELHANDGTIADLKSGKVIARIVNESADSYPKLSLLPHGTTYWWVQYDSSDTGVHSKSSYVAVNDEGAVVGVLSTIDSLQVVRSHVTFRVMQPLARFLWRNADEDTWGTCNGQCCKKKT